LLHHGVCIGADTAEPVRFRSEQQINNWSVRQFIDNLKQALDCLLYCCAEFADMVHHFLIGTLH